MYYSQDYDSIVISGPDYATTEKGVIGFGRRYSDVWWEISGIPMWASGLKDKNGKEIYGKDIISATYLTGKRWNGRVWWNEKFGAWMFNDRYLWMWLANGDAEVIGNIHENPELLK